MKQKLKLFIENIGLGNVSIAGAVAAYVVLGVFGSALLDLGWGQFIMLAVVATLAGLLFTERVVEWVAYLTPAQMNGVLLALVLVSFLFRVQLYSNFYGGLLTQGSAGPLEVLKFPLFLVWLLFDSRFMWLLWAGVAVAFVLSYAKRAWAGWALVVLQLLVLTVQVRTDAMQQFGYAMELLFSVRPSDEALQSKGIKP